MKIKIKEFKGIYTNIDENDNRLELVRDSENFYHKRGYLEVDPRNLAEDTNLPTPNIDFPSYSWTFETGIYTTLSEDILSTQDIPVAQKHDVLILIAKAEDSGTYHRLIYLYDITNSAGWYEMSKFGNGSPVVYGQRIIDAVNHDAAGNFSESIFSTTVNGTAFFQVEDGRLKIYLPHDAFWLGRIHRKIWVNDQARRWASTAGGVTTYPYFDYETGGPYWYIDRIVDHWDHTKQYISYNGFAMAQYPSFPTGTDLTGLMCANPDTTTGYEQTRRLGLMFDFDIIDDPNHITGGRTIKIGDPHDDKARFDPPNHVRSTRHTITDDTTGVIVRNPNPPFPINPEIWSFAIDYDRTDAALNPDWSEDDWVAGNYDKVFIGIRTSEAEAFRPVAGAWSTVTVPSYEAKTNNEMQTFLYTPMGGIVTILSGYALSISLEDWLNLAFEYGGDKSVNDVGWLTSQANFSIVATLVLDEREEVPVHALTYHPAIDAKYVIKISNIVMPWDISKRITRLRFYHSLKDAADYEMVKEFNLLESDSSIEDFEFSADDYTGDTLAANIGFLWNLWERPSDLQILRGFKSFITESGVSIGIAHRDEVAVYYSTFGGGNLMPDLIYDDNRMPITGVSELTAVANADGRLMVFTPNTSYVINAEEVAGVLAFRIEDTVELGVKDQHDVANIQGGVVVHTQHGIYITNGYETQLISEAIDDLIVQHYSTGRIYYNRYKHEVYYKPTVSEDLYRFRLKDSVWERIDKTVTVNQVQAEHEVVD